MFCRVLVLLILTAATGFAQDRINPNSGPRNLNDRQTPVHVDRGVGISPTTWGTLNKFTSIPYPSSSLGVTFSRDRVATFGGSIFDNYLVGFEDYGYIYANTILTARPLYVFDVSSLTAGFDHTLVGNANQTSGSDVVLQVFDAGDFGLESADPFGDALAGFAEGPTPIASTSIASDSPGPISFDVSGAVNADIGETVGGSSFSAFLLSLDDVPPAGSGYGWGVWDIAIQSSAPVVSIPTLGEAGLIVFITLLMGASVYLSRKRKLAA